MSAGTSKTCSSPSSNRSRRSVHSNWLAILTDFSSLLLCHRYAANVLIYPYGDWSGFVLCFSRTIATNHERSFVLGWDTSRQRTYRTCWTTYCRFGSPRFLRRRHRRFVLRFGGGGWGSIRSSSFSCFMRRLYRVKSRVLL